VAVGAAAPDYSARSLETGEQVSLESLRGRVVLLNVWAMWCGPCRHEMAALDGLRSRHAASGLEVIGVNIDGRGERGLVRTFSRVARVSYAVWLDPDDRVSSRFGVTQLPATFLIDREGRLRWRHVGTLGTQDTGLSKTLDEVLSKGSMTALNGP